MKSTSEAIINLCGFAFATYALTLCRPMMKATLRLQGLTKLDQLVSRVM